MSPEMLSLIGKIKKLFALSKGNTTEAESASALFKARQLMIENSIEENDLVENEIEDIIEIDFELSAKFNTPVTTLANALANTFFCKAILVKTKTGYHQVSYKVRFIGSRHDIATCSYIFGYLCSISKQKSVEYFESVRYTKPSWTPLGAKKCKNDFEYGFICAIVKKLEEIQKENQKHNIYEVQEKALVIVKTAKIDDYVKKTQGKIKTVTKKTEYNVKAFEAGSEHGEKQGIFRGVGGNNNQKQIGNSI